MSQNTLGKRMEGRDLIGVIADKDAKRLNGRSPNEKSAIITKELSELFFT